jgi:threonine/homoserine/homoserine lactone efflux protein
MPAMGAVTTSLIAYTAAASLLTVTPGLDTALVLRTATAEGARPAALAACGIVTACFGWAVMVAAGLGALLAASPLAYSALRVVGACYLLVVGLRLLCYPRRGFREIVDGADGMQGAAGADARARASARAAFARGALTNLLNPKVGVFYVSFLPQFVPAGVPAGGFILLLGAIHAVLGVAWFACLILATQPVGRLLRRPAVVTSLDRLTGAVFVAFGVALAV